MAAVGLAMAADIPNSFSTGGVISATRFNENFTYIADRLWDKNGSDLYYDGGNVGLGTSGPEHQLHVAGSGVVAGFGDGSGSIGVNIEGAAGTVRDLSFSSGDSARWIMRVDQSAESGSNSGSDLNLIRRDDAGGNLGAALFVKRSSGNVGIGTDNPSDLLHLASTTDDISLSIDAGADRNAGLSFREAGGGKWSIWNENTDDSLRIWTVGTGGTAVAINAAGNVGINTTTPGTELHIKQRTNNFNSGVRLESNSNTNYWNQTIGGANGLHFGYNGADIVYFTSSGDVGIGTTTPGGYKLYVVGNAWTTGTWGSSDARLKKNIDPLENTLERVARLNGVNFEWDIDQYPDRGFEKGRQIGLVAQEVEAVIPELVRTDNDGYKSVSYEKLSAVLVEAVKELKAENEALKTLVCLDRPKAALCL